MVRTATTLRSRRLPDSSGDASRPPHRATDGDRTEQHREQGKHIAGAERVDKGMAERPEARSEHAQPVAEGIGDPHELSILGGLGAEEASDDQYDGTDPNEDRHCERRARRQWPDSHRGAR